MSLTPARAIALHVCLLVGGATVAVWNAAHADDPVANPTGGGGTVQLEPVPPNQQPRRTRVVFVCRGAGPVIFSDRPCGESVEERSLRFAQPSAGRVASTAPAPAPAATRPRKEPEPKDEKPSAAEERCRRLRGQLEDLDDRMRSGYSAREAARLWNRWRELNSEIYSARC
jgi:hypothetical protein